MTDNEIFQQLKNEVLSTYRKHFPYFHGTWKSFSSQDIQNLISLLEEQKSTVSEKWIYTHLKPETNEKLPRKDMLDIFSRYCGYSGWDEFVFKNRNEPSGEVAVAVTGKAASNGRLIVGTAMLFILSIVTLLIFQFKSDPKKTIELKDEFTNKPLDSADVKVYDAATNEQLPVTVNDDKVSVSIQNKNSRLRIVSPFYKKREVVVRQGTPNATVLVQPDDHAMMLKAFMKSDLRDWQIRRQQLDQILSNELEVIIMLKDNLGAEYYNKKEFSQMLIIPTESVKSMKIIEITNADDNTIQFIRIVQE
ncbi:MAG TPA: hypothetical protein VF581_02620 [Flavobacterium sp.]|jgi:hypothetical protein